jgi:hypothetical protein
LQAENSQHTYSYHSFHVHPVFYFECKVTAQKKSDQKNPRKNEILALLQTLSPNLALFQRLQLVYGQHLRSFVSKTYVRLWNTLARGCEEDVVEKVKW